MAKLTIKTPGITGRTLVVTGAITVLVAVGVTGFVRHQRTRPSVSLGSIVGPISGFTPYFFPGSPPDSYTVNKSRSLFTDRLLQITLDKSGGPPLVLTEQALPAQLPASTLLSGGTQIKGAAGPATVSVVDEHTVGTLVPSGRRILILITGPQTASTDDITDLIRSLRPSP